MSKQFQHERECLERGSQRFFEKQDKVRSSGRLDQTEAATKLMKIYLTDVAELLQERANVRGRGRGAKYNGITKRAAQRLNDKGEVYEDWLAVAYIGMQVLFQTQSPGANNKVIHTVTSIATRLETDLKCRMFEVAEPGYYNTVANSFQEQMIESYQHKHRVMMHKFNEFGLEWADWDNVTRVQVGSRVLTACVAVMNELFHIPLQYHRGKTIRVVETTVEGDDWMAEFEKAKGLLSPLNEPCIEEPVDWYIEDECIRGGYHTPQLSSLMPFIKASDTVHKQWIADKPPVAHIAAINKMQKTGWCINAKVLEVQTEMFTKGLGLGLPTVKPLDIPPFPEHLKIPKETMTDAHKEEVGAWKQQAKTINTMNKENKGKVVAYLSIADLARRYVDKDKFYYVYTCDFRGRIYCATPGLSPQGEDLAKGLLRFSEGVRLGTNGLYWLAVQGANVFGEDKLTYEDRAAWVVDNEENIKRTCVDPIANRSWWSQADKPWQFLSFCLEWERTQFGRDKETIGYTAVGLDGSCNGLQHYSAILRDSVGAAATNLLHCEIPQDIYAEVAKTCEQHLIGLDNPVAERWLEVGITRKCAKRPVMTLPYGSTQQSCRQYLFEYVLEHKAEFKARDEDLWQYATFLTPIMWKSIGEVVIAARGAMDWLQSLSTPIVNDTTEPIKWLTPLDFPVYQRYFKYNTIEVYTQLCGGMRIHTADSIESVNKIGQKNGIAPNFIHSIDSTHMVMTINCTEFNSYAMIHDDFGTHAGNTEQLFQAIRESFVQLYTEHDPLLDWYNQQNRIVSKIPYPDTGDLDINDVLISEYFFG